jgi:hypothetical protein
MINGWKPISPSAPNIDARNLLDRVGDTRSVHTMIYF